MAILILFIKIYKSKTTMKSYKQLVKEKMTFEELEKLSKETKEMLKRDRPRQIGITTLMNAMGIEVVDMTDDEYIERYY